MAETLSQPGRALIDRVVNRMELAIPPNVTTEMANTTFISWRPGAPWKRH